MMQIYCCKVKKAANTFDTYAVNSECDRVYATGRFAVRGESPTKNIHSAKIELSMERRGDRFKI